MSLTEARRIRSQTSVWAGREEEMVDFILLQAEELTRLKSLLTMVLEVQALKEDVKRLTASLSDSDTVPQ